MESWGKARETLVVCHTVFQSTVNTVEMGVVHCMGYSVPTWFDREKSSTFVQILDQIGVKFLTKLALSNVMMAHVQVHTHTKEMDYSGISL